nr:MAG TPA: hypothetical protein [Caudoviricetes sp.]
MSYLCKSICTPPLFCVYVLWITFDNLHYSKLSSTCQWVYVSFLK